MPVPRSDTAGAAAPVVPSPRFSEDHLGRLYARVVREHGDRPAMRVLGERGFTWSYAEVGRRVEAVARAADGLQWTPLEVALTWVRDRPGVSAAIVGARTAAQLRGSLTVEECVLPDEIRAALDDVSGPNPSPAAL